jgi:hypothetical protein
MDIWRPPNTLLNSFLEMFFEMEMETKLKKTFMALPHNKYVNLIAQDLTFSDWLCTQTQGRY